MANDITNCAKGIASGTVLGMRDLAFETVYRIPGAIDNPADKDPSWQKFVVNNFARSKQFSDSPWVYVPIAAVDAASQTVVRTLEVGNSMALGLYHQSGVPQIFYGVSGGRIGEPAPANTEEWCALIAADVALVAGAKVSAKGVANALETSRVKIRQTRDGAKAKHLLKEAKKIEGRHTITQTLEILKEAETVAVEAGRFDLAATAAYKRALILAKKGRQMPALRTMERAKEFYLRSGDLTAAARASTQVAELWVKMSKIEEALLETDATRTTVLDIPDPGVRANTLYWRGEFHASVGAKGRATADFVLAADYYLEIKDFPRAAEAKFRHAQMLAVEKAFDQAARAYQVAEHYYQQGGQPRLALRARSASAYCLFEEARSFDLAGDWKKANALYEEALEIYRAIGDIYVFSEARCAARIALNEARFGDVQRAIAFLERAGREVNRHEVFSWIQHRSGKIRNAAVSAEKAADYYYQSERVADAAIQAKRAAELWSQLDIKSRAYQALHTAGYYFEMAGDWLSAAKTRRTMGEMTFGSGEFGAAAQDFAAARENFMKAGEPDLATLAANKQALSLLNNGQFEAAIEPLGVIHDFLVQQYQWNIAAVASTTLGEIYTKTGEFGTAALFYEQAIVEYQRVGNMGAAYALSERLNAVKLKRDQSN